MFWETFIVEEFTEIDQHTCNSIVDEHIGKTYDQQNVFLVKYHETKIDEEIIETMLCKSTLKYIPLNNVELTLSVATWY